MRKKLLDLAEKLDDDVWTPSDFALIGLGMEFKSYAPKEIEEELREHFSNRF